MILELDILPVNLTKTIVYFVRLVYALSFMFYFKGNLIFIYGALSLNCALYVLCQIYYM